MTPTTPDEIEIHEAIADHHAEGWSDTVDELALEHDEEPEPTPSVIRLVIARTQSPVAFAVAWSVFRERHPHLTAERVYELVSVAS